MWKRCLGAPAILLAAWSLASCQAGARKAAAPPPESEQAIGDALKNLYMAASAATPQSAEQQKIIRRMAEKASNGKELLLVMRAAIGVFPSGESDSAEKQVRSVVTAKLIAGGTLNQLIDYASGYTVDAEAARPLIQRMFELARDAPDPHVWRRIKVVANRLRLGDLEQQAQVRSEQLAGR